MPLTRPPLMGSVDEMTDHGIAVTIEQVTKHYEHVVAVDDLSLDVRPGEFLSLLGPSGCGKTTLLRLIAGFLTPDSGTIVVGGRCMVGVPPYDRNLGMVFQSYGLFPHLTVGANISFGLKMRGLSKRETLVRAQRALELVQLSGYEERYPKQLSGGQQQRVALARAIVYEPDVLLLDEPLGALDKKLREEMQIELKALQRSLGLTTIFVTHDQEEALILSDRIAVMKAGRIEQLAAPADVYERPASAFVSDFIGLTNLVHCRVRTDHGASLLVSEKGLVIYPPANHVLTDGAIVAAAVRPEKITLAVDAEPTRGRGGLGVVSNIIYVGAQTHYYVDLDEGDRLIVSRQNGSSSNDDRTGSPLKRGDHVTVSWEPHDVVVLGTQVLGGS